MIKLEIDIVLNKIARNSKEIECFRKILLEKYNPGIRTSYTYFSLNTKDFKTSP